MSSESTIQREIRVRMSQLKCPIFRYVVGQFITPHGSVVHIGEKGISDLIGIVPHVVTQEDVGRTLGVFCAMECKRTKGGRLSAEQGPFLKRVNELGGLGAVVRSAEDAESVVREKWDAEVVRKFV